MEVEHTEENKSKESNENSSVDSFPWLQVEGRKGLWHLYDQHVLSQVVPFFEDDSNRGDRDGRGHGRELQPQRFLLGSHHFAFVQLKRDTNTVRTTGCVTLTRCTVES